MCSLPSSAGRDAAALTARDSARLALVFEYASRPDPPSVRVRLAEARADAAGITLTRDCITVIAKGCR